MSIVATNYPDPQDKNNPVPAAVAWMKELHPDFAQGSYWVLMWVSRSAAAAASVPPPPFVETITISQGDKLSDGSTMPTIAALVSAAHTAQQANPALDPLSALKGVIYPYLMKHPKFVGTNPVQGP